MRSLLLTGDSQEIAEFYEIGKEIETYRSPNELVEKRDIIWRIQPQRKLYAMQAIEGLCVITLGNDASKNCFKDRMGMPSELLSSIIRGKVSVGNRSRLCKTTGG